MPEFALTTTTHLYPPFLRRLLPPQRLPNRLDHDRDPVRLAHDRLHADSVQAPGLFLPNPARHHQHLGVELTPGLEQPADLEQRIHAARRLHHLHPQLGLLDRLRERLEIRMVVVHHHHHVPPDRVPQVRRHRHLPRPQKLHELRRLDPTTPRGRLVPLEQTLVDPVRHRRRRYLAHSRHTLRAPVLLCFHRIHVCFHRIHGTRNTL